MLIHSSYTLEWLPSSNQDDSQDDSFLRIRFQDQSRCLPAVIFFLLDPWWPIMVPWVYPYDTIVQSNHYGTIIIWDFFKPFLSMIIPPENPKWSHHYTPTAIPTSLPTPSTFPAPRDGQLLAITRGRHGDHHPRGATRSPVPWGPAMTYGSSWLQLVAAGKKALPFFWRISWFWARRGDLLTS